MCGIHGFFSLSNISAEVSRHKIDRMLKMAGHRGPDQNDSLLFDRGAIGFGRLAIVAPNERSTIQSMPDANIFALLNGEIVNHQKLREQMKSPPAKHEGDSAIILPLFKEFGESFVEQLAGMFAIALYDQEHQTLQLWRDPLGIKPLYYHHGSDGIIFSSEIKSIYAVMDVEPELDFASIDHMLRYRFHPGRSTVFPTIKRVLPGETVRFEGNKISTRQYWTLNFNEQSSEKTNDVDSFRTLFENVVAEQAQADVPGGFFVSGGLDSSLVTSIVSKIPSPYKQAISIRFSPKEVEDEKYGEILEKYLGTKFEWVTISDSGARQALTELVKYIDEPLENPIHVGTYLMAKRASELGIKTVLTGDGSDEFFLGYARHACWFENSEGNATDIYPKWLWTMTPKEADELYTSEAASARKPMIDARNNIVEPFTSVEQALTFERLDRLSEYHCMRLDRMTMAFGVEAKVPFLDHRIVERALQTPITTLFGGSGKAFLQEVAKPWLPTAILNREKMHFPSLPDRWLSGDGAKWTESILLSPQAHIRKWMKTNVLQRYIQEHADGTHKHGRLLWALIVLELWLNNLSSWREDKAGSFHSENPVAVADAYNIKEQETMV
jgi:asparagine synthase (glutamine-hydrolysing)